MADVLSYLAKKKQILKQIYCFSYNLMNVHLTILNLIYIFMKESMKCTHLPENNIRRLET